MSLVLLSHSFSQQRHCCTTFFLFTCLLQGAACQSRQRASRVKSTQKKNSVVTETIVVALETTTIVRYFKLFYSRSYFVVFATLLHCILRKPSIQTTIWLRQRSFCWFNRRIWFFMDNKYLVDPIKSFSWFCQISNLVDLTKHLIKPRKYLINSTKTLFT